MIARLPQQWAQVDLLHAANLARCLADLEVNRKALLHERTLLDGRLNPRHALAEMLHKRSVYLTRVLQLQAVTTIGPARENAGAKAEAEKAAAALKKPSKRASGYDSDELLARPPRLQ